MLFTALTLLSLPTSSLADDTPSDTIKSFYNLINQQDCATAIKLRPNYSIERCKKISNTYIHTLKEEVSDNKNAVLLLELDSKVNKKKNYFFGYVRLSNKNGKWVIVGPYKNREDYWLDEYVKEYIPEGIKDASKEVIEEHKINVKDEPKKNKQTDIETDDEINIVAPGDSIDADEFAEKQTSKKLKTAIQAETAEATISSKNPEQEKFLLGGHAIEGNYTSLLNQLRKHFPQQASGNIILMDKSRRTLYVYGSNNLLLGFYPILSSANSAFPSGLYSINADQGSKSASNNAISQASTAVSLKRVFEPSSKNNVEPKQKEENKLYYIRDLFDADSTNSIQLSPIDINKLQELISSSTVAYSGQ